MKIYLDDARTPLDTSWKIVRNYDEFIAKVKLFIVNRHPFTEYFEKDEPLPVNPQVYPGINISFDHDLADSHYTPPHLWDDYDASKKWQDEQVHTEKTGYDCAKWLMKMGILPEMFWVHSANPVGADNILGLINNYYKEYGYTQRGFRTFWEVEPNHIDDIQ